MLDKLFKIKKTKYVEFVLILVLMLMPFYNNFFKTVASQYHFDVFMVDTQSLVWGRIANSDQNGIFSEGLFMGRCYPVPEECEGNNSKCAKRYQKKIYLNKYNIERFDIYKTHPAFHTLFYTCLNKILNLKPDRKVDLFMFITALINAFIFTFLITILFGRYGLFITFFITFFLLLNYWFVCYGNEMYMFIGFMFIPLVVAWKVFKEELSNSKVLLFITLAVLVKYLLTGFEFISCSVLMVFVPIVFFAIENKWKLKKIIFNSVLSVAAVLIATFLVLLVLSLQLWLLEGDFYAGIEHLMSRFVYRTVGAGEITPDRLELLSVMNFYWNESAIKLSETIVFSFGALVFLHFGASLLLLFFKKHKGLIAASFVALFVSLSWFVLFRQHAAVHLHVDPIVWYMPYLFFAFAVLGVLLKELFLISHKKLSSNSIYFSKQQ
ncbi:MAG: hypothetical protein COA97_03285 [Flavobacteriales bacterium]|nr:MAG: hypothetical protein COA97_03285 [Flavobacteriales bacterium]